MGCYENVLGPPPMLEKLVKDNSPSIIHVNQQSSRSSHETTQTELPGKLSGLVLRIAACCLNLHAIDLSA